MITSGIKHLSTCLLKITSFHLYFFSSELPAHIVFPISFSSWDSCRFPIIFRMWVLNIFWVLSLCCLAAGVLISLYSYLYYQFPSFTSGHSPPPLLLLLAFILMPSLFRPYVFCFSSFFWDFFSFCASSSSALGTCALFPWGSSQCGRGARGRSSTHGLCKLCAISSELGSPSCARWPNRLHLSP